MRTLRQAAEQLTNADAPDGLTAIAALLGFVDAPLALDAATRGRLGLAGDVGDVRIVRGNGALRALLIRSPQATPLRVFMGQIAASLAKHSAHVLWLVIATGDSGEVGVGCWQLDGRPPRVLALVARRARIVASDAEALCALAGSCEGADLLVHARWCQLLGRDALSRQFYRTLEQRVHALARSLPRIAEDVAAELALLTASRLLFLSFLEAKEWLNGERAFLVTRFDDCMAQGGSFHRRVLLPLFFGTLNTPYRQRAPLARRFGAVPFLNGGLFSRAAVERRHSSARFSDESLGELFAQLLGAYRFTAREDDTRWSEVAIDPEMLGHAFESLMASRERRVSGAFYTPQPLVAHIADEALVTALRGPSLPDDRIRTALAGGAIDGPSASALRRRLRDFTLVDPACGSGAFLVHLLERVTALQRAAGDTRAIAEVRRDTLARVIHGVDVNPIAVWLCELRLWLAVVIESPESRMSAVPPLPNLDGNVRVGDALAGDGFSPEPSLLGPSRAHARLRARYARAAGACKAPLRRALARDERQHAIAAIDRALVAIAATRRDRILARRDTDLFGQRAPTGVDDGAQARRLRGRAAALRRERRRLIDGGALPFSFPSHFGHVHARGGFDLVIGNPPWVRLHNIPLAARISLRQRFHVFRDAAWHPTFEGAPTPRGFGAQVDLASLFVERAVGLTAPGGTVALLLPAKLWRSLSGGPVRRLLSERMRLARVEDWTDAPCAFDAAVYPSIVIASRDRAGGAAISLVVRRVTLALEWLASDERLHLDADSGSPWLIVPSDVRAAFDCLSAHGQRLGDGTLGRATLGVKCGCNDAFTVRRLVEEDQFVSVEHLGRHGRVERALLRPLLRGDALTPWCVPTSHRAIVWTHDSGGSALDVLPAGAAQWLAPWRRRLAARTDLRGARRWWTLFRTEGADARRPRVVWSDFGRAPRAALLPAGAPTVPLNSCYVLPCDDVTDALALTALLNGPLAAAWLNTIAEPARGGWHRYLAWTVSLLPLPSDWAHARAVLAPIAERAILGDPPSANELLAASCRAYRVRLGDIAPLVAWSG